MLLTITLSIAFLVAFNLLLLKISCNKTTKRDIKTDKKPVVLRPETTIESAPERLAPTGS